MILTGYYIKYPLLFFELLGFIKNVYVVFPINLEFIKNLITLNKVFRYM